MSTPSKFPTPPPNAVSFAFRLPDGDVGQMGWMSMTLYPAASKLVQLDPDVQVVFAVPEEAPQPREVRGVDDSVRRFLSSKDLYELLLNIQNGISSPADSSMANGLIRRLDKIRDSLTATTPQDAAMAAETASGEA